MARLSCSSHLLLRNARSTQRLAGEQRFEAASGLCQLLPSAAATAPSFLASIGVKLEYSFGVNANSGVSAAYEPSFDKLVCGLGERGFSTNKKQVGFDFFRIWRR